MLASLLSADHGSSSVRWSRLIPSDPDPTAACKETPVLAASLMIATRFLPDMNSPRSRMLRLERGGEG